MSGSGYFTRLAAVLVACALLGLMIIRPDAGERAVDKVISLTPSPAALATRPCAQGEAPLKGPFANIDDIVSVSPLGAITAPGEALPAPYIRINTRKGETIFERRMTAALSPGRADITAIERRFARIGQNKIIESWTVHLQICDSIDLYYDRLDSLDPDILRRAGGLTAFTEIGGPEHLAVTTQIRINLGDTIGSSDGFDVALHDLSAKPATLARPERYRTNPYARAAVLDAPPSILEAISSDQTKARCALNYLNQDFRADWEKKLGDAFGIRRAKGENACRTALIDMPGTAQGTWFTDSSHNAATTKVSAIALAPDTIDQSRLIFALHGRVKSLTPELIALAPVLDEQKTNAAKDFLTFEKGNGLTNASFALVKENETYCYNRLRANFVGPKILGIILLQVSTDETGTALMKIEARGDILSCADLREPWTFSGNETTFYR